MSARSGKGVSGVGSSRSITIGDGASATLLAEEIARLMSKMRKNPVEVVSPEKLRDEDARKRDEGKKERDDLKKKEEPKKKGEKDTRLPAPRSLDTAGFVSADEGGLVDPK